MWMDKIILWGVQDFQMFEIQPDAICGSNWKQNDTKVKNQRNDNNRVGVVILIEDKMRIRSWKHKIRPYEWEGGWLCFSLKQSHGPKKPKHRLAKEHQYDEDIMELSVRYVCMLGGMYVSVNVHIWPWDQNSLGLCKSIPLSCKHLGIILYWALALCPPRAHPLS